MGRVGGPGPGQDPGPGPARGQTVGQTSGDFTPFYGEFASAGRFQQAWLPKECDYRHLFNAPVLPSHFHFIHGVEAVLSAVLAKL